MDNDVRKLIEFLAEDCGWPLEEEQIDRSAWPVNNVELGLNDEVSIDSVEIFELRPLTTNQPWGVFFVAVKGTSNLSMTLLRKLLRGLVKKKRASADTSNLQQWNLEDLMFVCSLDEPENTTRYFAHFKEQENGLPKLMIGAKWQDSQPENEINAAKLKLKNNLKWPDNEANIDSWREQWGKAFPVGHKEVIKTSSNLASALAKYAVIIKRNIPDIYSIESDNGPVHRLFEAFKEALISDLEIEDFADMVAQTITYGLFSARATGSELTGIETLSECIPATNPFLKDLFTELATLSGTEPTDLDFDDLAINELISMLNQANIESVMNDFGSQFKGGKEDPVIHFYETFLSNYDNELRAERGVFYTPKPVVSFIVKSVDERLRSEFGLEDGLADITTWGEMKKRHPELNIPEGILANQSFVQILDPSTGTGTFLVEVISVIHNTMSNKWKSKSKKERQGLWNAYVSEHLLPRLYGFELMMAPYSVAHLKIILALRQTGYEEKLTQRLQIYLTNTLEKTSPLSKWIPDFISQEHAQVAQIKESIRFTVIIGNPPYASISSNLTSELRRIVNPFRYIDNVKIKERSMLQFEKNLQDDYVKFLAYCREVLMLTNCGICGLITNHSFLDGPTLRGVRYNLISTFNQTHFLDLHGNANKNEKTPEGNKDENVFDIRQGVAISILIRSPTISSRATFHGDLWGERKLKYMSLNNSNIMSCGCTEITPLQPFFFIIPTFDEEGDDWEKHPKITDLFKKWSTGTESGFDELLVAFDEKNLRDNLRTFSSNQVSQSQIIERWKVDKGHAKKLFNLRSTVSGFHDEEIKRFQIRAFDYRYAFLRKNLLKTNSFNVMLDLSAETPGIITTRQTKENFSVFAASSFVGHKCTSSYDRSYVFPSFTINDNKRIPSMNTELIARLKLQLENDETSLSVEQTTKILFGYVYGILSSQSYETRYSSRLKRDWPRIPITTNIELFHTISSIGNELINLHLMDSKLLDNLLTTVIGTPTKMQVEKVSYSDDVVWVDKSQTIGFKGITKKVWEFQIGGRQVCRTWLKEREEKGGKNPREGCVLSKGDISYYQRIIVAVHETICIVNRIDRVIEENGGWPLEGSDEFEVPDERDQDQTRLFDF